MTVLWRRTGASGSGTRAKNNDRGTDERIAGAKDVPPVRNLSLHDPKPNQRRADIDADIGGVGPSSGAGLDQGEKLGERRERDQAGRHPKRGFSEVKPSPEREASGDLGEGGE